MTGIHVTLKDGVSARVAEIAIIDTYEGQLAGTMTVGTRFRLPAIAVMMKEQKDGSQTRCYYLPPELVDEAELRGIPGGEAERIRRHTELGKCLKEQHIAATLHFSDEDYCHIIEVHWFQNGRELAEKPLPLLIQEAIGQLSFEGQLYPCCEHVDWREF